MNEETVTCIGFDGKEYVTPVSELIPRTSVYGIIIKDGALLLLEQTNGYDLPGGGLDEAETEEDGVAREVLEETGYRVRATEKVGMAENYFKRTQSDGAAIHSFLHYYLGHLMTEDVSDVEYDTDEREYAVGAIWMPLTKLDEITLGSSFDWRPIVKQVISK